MGSVTVIYITLGLPTAEPRFCHMHIPPLTFANASGAAADGAARGQPVQ